MSEREDEGDRGRDEGRESGKDESSRKSGESRGHHENLDGKPKRSLFSRPLVRAGIAIAVLALIVCGIFYWLHARQYESTDDAFIDTHIVQIAPQIAAQVTRIYVTDNQLVRAAQPLVDLNPADPQARIEQIVAQQGQAETQIAQARANEAAAAAQAQNAARDLARYRYL